MGQLFDRFLEYRHIEHGGITYGIAIWICDMHPVLADETWYGFKVHNFTEQWRKPSGKQFDVIIHQMAGYKAIDDAVENATEWILNRPSIKDAS